MHVEYAEEKANAQKLEQRVTGMNESRRLIKTKPNKKANREPSSNGELCELERKSCSDNTSQAPQLTLVAGEPDYSNTNWESQMFSITRKIRKRKMQRRVERVGKKKLRHQQLTSPPSTN